MLTKDEIVTALDDHEACVTEYGHTIIMLVAGSETNDPILVFVVLVDGEKRLATFNEDAAIDYYMRVRDK